MAAAALVRQNAAQRIALLVLDCAVFCGIVAPVAPKKRPRSATNARGHEHKDKLCVIASLSQ